MAHTTLQADPLQLVSYAANFPLGELYAWPVPTLPQEVTVYPWQVLSTWPDFDTDLLLPPGYDRYLRARWRASWPRTTKKSPRPRCRACGRKPRTILRP